MIVGAMVVRGRLDDRNEDAGQVYRLVCAADLGQVCAELDDAFPGRVDVTVEGAGATADRLRRLDGDPELDGWLVADPWPALVDEARRAGRSLPCSTPRPPPLARSPLVIVAWKDRAGALAPTCPGGKVGWKCLGDAAGRPDAKVGHADAARDGTGLLVLAQATVEWFDGRTDLSTFDLDDEGFQRWFAALERPMEPAASSPLDRMLLIGRAVYDFVGHHRGRRDQGRHRRQTGRAHQDLPFVHGDRRRGPGRHPRRPGGSPARDRLRPGPRPG